MAGAAGRDNQKRANRIRAAAARWPRVALLALAGLLLAVDASAWWNTTWSHRRKLTFDNSVSGTSHANFPVLVVLNSSRIDYSKTKNDGSDLRFVDSDDLTLLDHEIEKWDETGNSYVWVRVPQVAAASNTDFIWMYYGNAAAAALPLANQRATWTATYMMVQHFDEAAGAHLDSTVNGNNSSVIDVQTQASPLGKIGAADVFDGLSTDNVDVPDSATLDMLANDSFTIEAWIKTSSNAQQMVVSKEDGVSEYQLWVDAGVATFWLNDGVDNARISAVGPTVNDGAWHYIVGRWSDASNTAEIFVDGTSMGALIQPALDAMASATPLVIGQEGDASRGFDFTGTIDEVRVRNSSLSTDPWIRAQYLSMSDTGVGVVGSFVSYGPEAAQCCGLVVTETATTITVNGPNRFDMRFNTATGGGIDRFIDAEENTGVDLAGGDPGLQPALFSDEVHDGSNKTTAANTQGAELDLLEATPARVKVRQEAFDQRGVNTEIVPALKGYGTTASTGSGEWRSLERRAPAGDRSAAGAAVPVDGVHHRVCASQRRTGYSQHGCSGSDTLQRLRSRSAHGDGRFRDGAERGARRAHRLPRDPVPGLGERQPGVLRPAGDRELAGSLVDRRQPRGADRRRLRALELPHLLQADEPREWRRRGRHLEERRLPRPRRPHDQRRQGEPLGRAQREHRCRRRLVERSRGRLRPGSRPGARPRLRHRRQRGHTALQAVLQDPPVALVRRGAHVHGRGCGTQQERGLPRRGEAVRPCPVRPGLDLVLAAGGPERRHLAGRRHGRRRGGRRFPGDSPVPPRVQRAL